MEHDLVLEGKVVRPSGVEELEVGVSEGVIREVRRQGVKGQRRIRAGRSLVFPGFVDIHVHLREPGWEYKEDFRTGTQAAIHGGVTTVADMPNNPIPTFDVRALREKVALARRAVADVKFYLGTKGGVLGPLDGMDGLAVGVKLYLGKSTGGEVFPTSMVPTAFRAAAEAGLPVSLHCEDQEVLDRSAARDPSPPGSRARGRPPEAEVEAVKKVVASVREVPSVRANVCHASTRTALELVEGAGKEGLDLKCEAALHHLFFDSRAMRDNPLLGVNPPLRGPDDRVALVEGLANGLVSFLVTDHAPHTREEKISEGLKGVPGLDDYGHIVSWLVKDRGVDPVTLARVASKNPATFIGLRDRGEVALGRVGDFSVVDINSPEKATSDKVRSKCGWTPYEGVEFPGRVRWTIRRGETLVDDFEQVT